jgi:hypothetical protein
MPISFLQRGYLTCWLTPGVFHDIKGFSYGKLFVLELEEGGTDKVKVSLVRTGTFDIFDDEIIAELPSDYVIRNAVIQVEDLDGLRSLVGSHVCKIIEVHSTVRHSLCRLFSSNCAQRHIFGYWTP